MIIRAETPDDEHAIHRVTKAAFTNVSHTRGMEAQIVCKLRKDGDLRLSIVAEVNGKIVGHVAFSPITVAGRHDDWFGLGPVAVRPDMQRGGIGSALVTCGLTELRAAGAKGCALVGNPAFYDGMTFFDRIPADFHLLFLLPLVCIERCKPPGFLFQIVLPPLLVKLHRLSMHLFFCT